MGKKYSFKEISRLLMQCAKGEADAEKVAKDLSHLKFEDTVVDSAMHFLHHFYADADLRAQDQEYDEYMKEKLFSYASQLKAIKRSEEEKKHP